MAKPNMKVLVSFVLAVLASSALAQQSVDCSDVKAELVKARKRLDDWAELGRYREANKLAALPKPGEQRVVFIGDSITDLWDEKGFGGFFPGKPYINRGISGQTTSQMLVRFRADVIALRPKVVVILAGTNDIAGNTGPMTLEESGDNIASMSEVAKTNGIRVVLSSVLPVSDTVRGASGEFYIQTKSRPPSRILMMNEWLKNFARTNGYIYLDYYGAMVDESGFVKDGLTFDGLHPNAKGYAVMAPIAERAIREALRSKK